MSAQTDIGALITRTAGIHGGRPHLAGTGVTVRRIVVWHRTGLSPEEIADTVGHLSLAQIYAALAYYHLNQAEIDADLIEEAQETARIENLLRRTPQ